MSRHEVAAVVLAAGVGSRLRPLTDSVPKCLVPVGGKPVLGWQLDAFFAAGVSSVTVVAGYRSAAVVDFCRPYQERVSVVVNQDYKRTNNMYSLRLAGDRVDGHSTVLCNGDVVFQPQIVQKLLQHDSDNAIATEVGRWEEESMKVTVGNEGTITKISKAIPRDEAYGVSIDLYRFSPAGMNAILDVATRLIEDESETNLWTEVAIARALPHLGAEAASIDGCAWVEIDNHDDLSLAERLFS